MDQIEKIESLRKLKQHAISNLDFEAAAFYRQKEVEAMREINSVEKVEINYSVQVLPNHNK